MERIFTETESRQFIEAEKLLRSKGLIVDEQDGKEAIDHNAERIQSFFEINPNIEVTVQSILDACEQMRAQLHWKSAAQLEYDAAYSVLTQTQKDAFGAWWYHQKGILILEGDQGYSNATNIISWMKGRSFEARNFELAVSNLVGSRGLHFVPQFMFRPSQHTGGSSSLLSKKDTNLTARDHARIAAEAAAARPGGKLAPTTDYRTLAESVKGRTHSETERIGRYFVTSPGGRIDWQATWTARRRMAGL